MISGVQERGPDSRFEDRPAIASWLFWVLITCTLLNISLFAFQASHGATARQALNSIPTGQVLRIQDPVWIDSWWPMLRAYNQHRENPDESLYQVFSQGVKYQYPPSALLPLALLPEHWLKATDDRRLDESFMRVLSWLSRLAVFATWAVAAWLMVIGTRGGQWTSRERLLIVLLTLPLAVTFYPVIHSYSLGQIQVFLNLGAGLALLAFCLGRRATAGALLAACTLVKPQFGLVLLWSLWRREHRFTLGYSACLGAGLVLSVWAFGWASHFDYLNVLREISRTGESLYLNQSVNGLLNRWFENGAVVPGQDAFQSDFAPYHPWVYALTLASSLLIVLLALEPWRLERRSRGILDLAIVIAAATVASPVAWNHHYGSFLHLFAVAVPIALASGPLARLRAVLLGACFVLMGFEYVDVPWFIAADWRIFLLSHLFLGAVLFFFLLIWLRGAPGKAMRLPAVN